MPRPVYSRETIRVPNSDIMISDISTTDKEGYRIKGSLKDDETHAFVFETTEQPKDNQSASKQSHQCGFSLGSIGTKLDVNACGEVKVKRLDADMVHSLNVAPISIRRSSGRGSSMKPTTHASFSHTLHPTEGMKGFLAVPSLDRRGKFLVYDLEGPQGPWNGPPALRDCLPK